MSNENKAKGTLWVLICVLLWAMIPVVSKLGQAELDNHQLLFWSSLISFLVLFLTVVGKGQFSIYRTIPLRQYLFLFLLGMLGTYLYYLLLYLGYAKAKGMEVLVVQYTWPILIVVLSIFILREKLTVRKIAAIMCGFVGVLIVLTKGDFQNIHFSSLQVILWVLAGSFCFALFSVLSKTVKIDPIAASSIYFFIAAVASFVSMMFFSKWQFPTAQEWWPVILNGVLVNGFSYVFWIFALRSTNASFVAPFTYLTPILSAVYLVIFFREPFLPAYGLGLVLVLTGGLINLDFGKKRGQMRV